MILMETGASGTSTTSSTVANLTPKASLRRQCAAAAMEAASTRQETKQTLVIMAVSTTTRCLLSVASMTRRPSMRRRCAVLLGL
jgi:hypothetical protein